MIFIAVLTCFLALSMADIPVENVPLYNHGIIYERLDNVKLELGKWTFQSTYNLKTLEEEIQTIDELTGSMKMACNKLDTAFNIDCMKIYSDISLIISDLLSLRKIINAQCSVSIQTGNLRSKRQIDFLGHIFKEITGTMDHEDSQRIDQDIKNLHENEMNLKNELQKQTVAIETVFDIANRSISTVQKQIKDFTSVIDFYNKKRDETKTRNTVKNLFLELFSEINLELTRLIKKRDLFLSLMKTGYMPLTHEIFSPIRLLGELKKI